jgi:5-methylcytosine-specific restriction endonuclease McrA
LLICFCGKDFELKDSIIAKSKTGNFYCSKASYGKSCRKPKNCPVCGIEFLSGKRSSTCSRTCSNINRKGIRYKTGKLADKDLSAVLIAERGVESCEKCGYDRVPQIIQMHHIIERSKGGSDDPDNLELLCPTCHYEEHHFRRVAENHDGVLGHV